jgi:hypothetical protein
MNKRVTILLFIGLILTTCAGQPVVGAQIKYAVLPESPRPGDPVTIGVNSSVKEAVVFVNGKQVAKSACFSVPAENGKNGFTAAIITIPSTVEAETVIIKLNNASGVVCEIPVKLTPKEFRSETIVLTPSLTSLVGDPNPQRTAESEKLWEILITNGNVVYHPGKFVLPVTATRRTSQFGTRRVNQYSDGRKTTSIHAGVDFGIPTGTEVSACGRGKVVFSRMRILTGYSVIIEHEPGVYSLYYHLDSVIAQEGTIVEAGAVIALSGSTGFSTGPHLHWEIRVSTENTDPDILVERPLIDKDLIISKLYK